MTDIVGRWKDELESLGGEPMNTAEHYANDMAGIIETLRKQVKELEDAADEYKQLHGFAVNGFNRLTEELAALKQQGEPVARNQTELQDIYDTLYTSAPTIPQTCFSAADMADAAAKAAQVEREECAKVCDAEAAAWKKPKYSFASAAGEHCARAIRMRSNAEITGRTLAQNEADGA